MIHRLSLLSVLGALLGIAASVGYARGGSDHEERAFARGRRMMTAYAAKHGHQGGPDLRVRELISGRAASREADGEG